MKTTLKILIEKINESIDYVENEQTFNTEREKLLTSQAYKNIICMIDDFKLLDKERNMIIDSYADGKISVVTGDNIPYHEYFNKKWALEEAAEKWVFDINGNKWSNNDNTAGDNYGSFITGAKWQQEQNKNLYSEEEVRKIFDRYNEVIAHRDIEEWQPWIDKQFKKK